MLLQKLGKADDGVHWRPDIVAHIEKEAGLGFVCQAGLGGGFLNLSGIYPVLVALLLKLPESDSRQKCDGKGNHKICQNRVGG